MKRSSCLSALFVGLSLTTASVAAAAPSPSAPAPQDEAKAKPTLVAQAKPAAKPTTKTVQPTDPPPAEGGTAPAAPTTTPTEPAPAPAEPAPAETTQPAISLGGAATPSDSPTAAPEEPKKKPKPRPWAGTNIYVTTSMTTATIFKGQQQDYNPTVDSSIWLLPRYAINDAFQLRGRLIFNYEYTNSDTTQTRNEPRFSDTTLSLFYRKIPEIPGVGVKPMVAINAGLPTSPESRARTLIFTPGVTAQFSKSFEHFLGGELLLLSSVIYSHPIYRYETPGTRIPPRYGFQCVGGNSCQDQLSGVHNPSDVLSYTFLVTAEWGKWSPALYYLGSSQWAYQPNRDVANPVDGTPIPSQPGGPTNVRQTSYFSAWLDYNANAWLTAEVGYWLSRSLLAGDGNYGNPFFDRYQDMRVYVGANFSIDNILKALEGGATDAGIVRAKAKTPMWNF